MSNEQDLYINLAKTKIVVFRNKGSVKPDEKWFLNGDKIEISDQFIYLGMLFCFNGTFLQSQKMLSNQGRNAVLNMYSKIKNDYYNYETLLSLFDTYVSCIINYGCEVWGSHKGEDIEKVHLNFLKLTLKARKSTVNYMVYFELGRFPMYIERYCRMMKYWFKILNTDNVKNML